MFLMQNSPKGFEPGVGEQSCSGLCCPRGDGVPKRMRWGGGRQHPPVPTIPSPSRLVLVGSLHTKSPLKALGMGVKGWPCP